jgi:hypothetical protein
MTGMGMDLEGSSRNLFEVLPRHLPGLTAENHQNIMIAGAPAKVRTENLPNTNLQLSSTSTCSVILGLFNDDSITKTV